MHWLKKEYIDRENELDIYVEKFGIDDNTFLDAEYVKQAIYAKTQVQTSYSVNFEAVSMNGIDLKRYSYSEYLITSTGQDSAASIIPSV